MTIDLTGKVALVTGASRGIGCGISVALANAGASVAVHYNSNGASAKELQKRLGQGAHSFQADLGDSEACDGLFEAVIAHYGRLDILINNAGIAVMAPMESPTSEWMAIWDRTMNVNLCAAGLLCRRALGHFVERGGGRIINIASRAAFRGDTPDLMAYAASKAGMVAMTRTIARAYGKDNVCAFVIAPGFVRTDMAQDSIDAYGEDFVISDLALNRLTLPEDVAPMVVLLASGLADHATGTSIDINAGSYVH